MKKQLLACLAIWTLVITGCSHAINIAPNATNQAGPLNSDKKIKANVGVVYPVNAPNIQITTAGGGGDRVTYYPYRDIDAGYRRMLMNVFQGVTNLTSFEDEKEIKRAGVSLIITPEITTNSGSTSALTWPPTNFTVDLTSSIRDANGKIVASPRVVGNGQAVYKEFFSDRGLAGKRAMEDALNKMQQALVDTDFGVVFSPEENVEDNAVTLTRERESGGQGGGADARLKELKELWDRGLISRAEYEKKRAEILNSL